MLMIGKSDSRRIVRSPNVSSTGEQLLVNAIRRIRRVIPATWSSRCLNFRIHTRSASKNQPKIPPETNFRLPGRDYHRAMAMGTYARQMKIFSARCELKPGVRERPLEVRPQSRPRRKNNPEINSTAAPPRRNTTSGRWHRIRSILCFNFRRFWRLQCPQLQHLDEERKAHCEVHISLGDFLVETLGHQ